jgi:Mn2+/Fe2+ NRAMP family transporter
MKQLLSVTLGVLTSVGGWLEIGTLAAAISGGAQFGFKHVWVAVLGGVCLIFLVEMAGRFTAVSGETVSHGLRKRFSFGWFGAAHRLPYRDAGDARRGDRRDQHLA